MPTGLDTSNSALTPLHPDLMGRKVPNLVVVEDSQDPKGGEFRVQLEMVTSDDQVADDLHQSLRTRTVPSLGHALELATPMIDGGASPIFQLIVRLAFEDNIDDAGKPDRGRKVPNLVILRDVERGREHVLELRIQAEIYVDDPDVVRDLQEDLRTASADSLRHAQTLAEARVDPLATDKFRQIVALAFDDNISRH